MEWVINQNEISEHILKLEQSFLNPVKGYSGIISYLSEISWDYRSHAEKDGFENETDEIQFFKTVKPFVLSQLIQYKKQLAFELENRDAIPSYNIEAIKTQIRNAQSFISKHQQFLFYMETERTDHDEFYFKRQDELTNDHFVYSAYNHDRTFSTVYDVLWSEILANKGYIKFLKSKLIPNANHSINGIGQNINWTGSKVALTELAIALKHSGSINHGNISLKDTVLLLQDFFNTDLGDFHHTAIRLKNRSHATKFVDKLKDSLENWMVESDI